ncbi:hypothetical protein BD410DRAFT_807051 [Rickenella mellea]|uniref:Uncharacterized protein n=1 Tax=Rickenella mellea TaxID=50990 RepID=A0A4Y7PRY3_9AGAM|nr:hypothetical protein BD410DRAFT_807051 [Rickenella mellea]
MRGRFRPWGFQKEEMQGRDKGREQDGEVSNERRPLHKMSSEETAVVPLQVVSVHFGSRSVPSSRKWKGQSGTLESNKFTKAVSGLLVNGGDPRSMYSTCHKAAAKGVSKAVNHLPLMESPFDAMGRSQPLDSSANEGEERVSTIEGLHTLLTATVRDQC